MLLIVAWLAVVLASAVTRGAYWPGGLALVVVATVVLLSPVRPLPAARWTEVALWTASLFCAVLGLLDGLLGVNLLHPPLGGAGTQHIGMLLHVLQVGVVLSYARPFHPWFARRRCDARFVIALSAASALGAIAIVSWPHPLIDVFNFLNEGVKGLARGWNPYAMHFTPLPRNVSPGYDDPAYHFDVYGYLPGTLLLTLPVVLLDDVRWLMLLAVALAAILLRKLSDQYQVPRPLGALTAVAFLANPGLLWVLQQAWIEPIVVCLWLAALVVHSKGRPGWSAALAGGLLSLKQYTLPLLLPLVVAGLGGRRLAAAGAVALASCVPFLAWGPSDFVWDTLWYHVQAPARPDALSLGGYILRDHGVTLPGWVSAVAPAGVGAYALWILRRYPRLGLSLRLVAAFYAALFLFNKFAFANYYFLLQTVVLVGLLGEFARDALAVDRSPLTATDGVAAAKTLDARPERQEASESREWKRGYA